MDDNSVNPIQVQKFLKDLDYPAGKSDLLDHARIEGATENVISTLDMLPDRLFEGLSDVTQAIGDLR